MTASDRKGVLVEAALNVIARNGVAAATTRAITAEAGMSLASFHYVFPSRQALLAEVIERALEREIVMQESLALSAFPLDERVYRSFLASLDLLASDPNAELALFELMQYALRTPGLEDLARRQYERYWDIAEGFIRQAGTQWDRPIREIAQCVVAMNDGIALAWLATKDDEVARRMAAVAAAAVCQMSVDA